MLADVEVDDRLRGWTSLTRPKSPRKRAVGTAKKSMETRSRTGLARNVRQVCDGEGRDFGISWETARSATAMPSLRSSPVA